MSSLLSIVEIETSFSFDIRGRHLKKDALIECVTSMGFVYVSSKVVTKTLYSAGRTTLHHLETEEEESYYFKESLKYNKDWYNLGYKITTSLEYPALAIDIEGRRIVESENRTEDLYMLGDIKLYIRTAEWLSVEIERELLQNAEEVKRQLRRGQGGDINDQITDITKQLAELTEDVLMCLSFSNVLKLDPLYIKSEEYKVVSSIINDKLKGMKRPIPLKWPTLTTMNLSDYFVSKKADGLRVYLLAIRASGVFLISGSGTNIVKVSKHVPALSSTRDVILEGELMNPEDMKTPTMRYTMILYNVLEGSIKTVEDLKDPTKLVTVFIDSLKDKSYDFKLSKLSKYTDDFVYLPFNLTTKQANYTSASRESIMNAIADILGRCDDIFSINIGETFKTDGLVFTPNSRTGEIYKWKPVDMLTIDLQLLNRKLVYDRAEIEYKGNYNLDEFDEDVKDGSVHEFLIQSDGSLTYVKPRPDRLYPNNYETVRSMMSLARSPITEQDLLGVTAGVYRKYHNARKQDLLKQASRRGSILLDIGSGKGGSVISYVHYSIVVVVDPDPTGENMPELIRRAQEKNIATLLLSSLLEDITIESTAVTTIYYHVGYMDNEFYNIILESGLMFNVVSSFFTLQYFDPLMAVALYDIDPTIASEQVETLRLILSEHMMKGSAFVGISLDDKYNAVKEISREALCRGYEVTGDKIIAFYERECKIDDVKEECRAIAQFNIRGLPTLPYEWRDYFPQLKSHLSLFMEDDVVESVNITPLHAKHLVTSLEWIELSFYYSTFILAEKRSVEEEISMEGTFIHVSSITENSVHYSSLTLDDKTTYEIGVMNASLDACILTVLYEGFTFNRSKASVLRSWSNVYKSNNEDKIRMIQEKFGVGLVIVKVKNNNIITLTPSNFDLSRYIYVFSDETKYCLLMTKKENLYQRMYTKPQIIKLVV